MSKYKYDRRGFLSLLGVTTAVVPHLDGGVERHTVLTDEKAIETHREKVAGYGDDVENIAACDWRDDYTHPSPAHYDVVSQFLYDRVDVRRNDMQARYVAFNGINGRDYLPGTTNVQPCQRLPQPYAFVVRGIGFMFGINTPDKYAGTFADRYGFRLSVGCKYYHEGPLALAAQLNRETANILSRPPGSEGPKLTGPSSQLDIPIVILSEMNFRVEIQGTPFNPCGKMSLWVVLNGTLARGIS